MKTRLELTEGEKKLLVDVFNDFLTKEDRKRSIGGYDYFIRDTVYYKVDQIRAIRDFLLA